MVYERAFLKFAKLVGMKLLILLLLILGSDARSADTPFEDVGEMELDIYVTGTIIPKGKDPRPEPFYKREDINFIFVPKELRSYCEQNSLAKCEKISKCQKFKDPFFCKEFEAAKISIPEIKNNDEPTHFLLVHFNRKDEKRVEKLDKLFVQLMANPKVFEKPTQKNKIKAKVNVQKRTQAYKLAKGSLAVTDYKISIKEILSMP